MANGETADDLANRLVGEILSEEDAAWAGPECADSAHTPASALDLQRSYAGHFVYKVHDYTHCATCMRFLRRANSTAPFAVVHHQNDCRCAPCVAAR